MLAEKSKTMICKEMKSHFDSKKLDEAIIVLDRLLSTQLQVEDLSGVGNKYTKAFDQIFDENTTIGALYSSANSLMNSESLFRAILYYYDKDEYYRIANDRENGFYRILDALRVGKVNAKYDTPNPARYDTSGYKFSYISDTYNMRNADAHRCRAWNYLELFGHVHAVIYTVLFTIIDNKGRIIKGMDESFVRSISVDAYLDVLISSFKTKMNAYVNLEGKESLESIDQLVTERNETTSDKDDELDNDLEDEKRSGKINDIRNNQLPERRMMLLGEAGTGKSTTMEYLAYDDALKRKRNSSASMYCTVLKKLFHGNG